jgi:hypothetical protein
MSRCCFLRNQDLPVELLDVLSWLTPLFLPVSCEAESLLMAISILPQLTILNRKIISSDDRRKPRRGFCHSLSQDP